MRDQKQLRKLDPAQQDPVIETNMESSEDYVYRKI